MIGSHPDNIHGLSCGPHGLLVAASGFGEVRLWDPVGKELGSFKSSNPCVCWYGEMSSKGVVATAFGDGTLQMWEPAKKTHRTVATLGGIVASVAWSKDGERLFTGNCGDKTVRYWSAQGELIAEGKTKKSATWFVALTPDGRTGLSGSGDKLVHVWDATACRETGTLAGHDGKILQLAVAGDGDIVASASQDRTARVWDLQTGQTVTVFDGHRKQVVWVAFEPGGGRVATASSDRTVRIWSATSGKELMKLPFDAAPAAVAWGKELYVACGKDLLAFGV
jgi:WD40 repeat protein